MNWNDFNNNSFDITTGKATYGFNRIDRNDISLNYFIYSNPTTTSAYWGAVLAHNGLIYYIPYSETTIEEIDPYVANGIFFGSAGASTTKWLGGFLGVDGKIYCIPSTSSVIGIIDPVAKTIDTTSFTAPADSVGQGCYGPNGLYYTSPNQSTTAPIYSIDVLNKRTVLEYTISGSKVQSGAILNPNDGLIYYIPRDDDDMLIYDVYKRSLITITMPSNGFASFGYNGGVLAPNNCIYMAPSSADYIMEFNCYTRKARTIGTTVNGGTLAFSQAIYAPDDYIYFIPYSYVNMWRLDYHTGETIEIPILAGSQKWGPGCFDLNGKFWTSTYGNDSILVLDFQQKMKNKIIC